MTWKNFVALCAATMIPLSTYAQTEQLKTADVQRIMQQLFQRHVEKKQIDAETIQNAIRIYIDQFDPYRVYLLEQEVKPYAHLSPSQLRDILSQYSNNDFSIFNKLDALFQRGIERSRAVRQKLYKDQTPIFALAAKTTVKKDEQQQQLLFLTSPAALQERTQEYLVDYIKDQIKRFGMQDVLSQRQTVLENFEDDSRSRENPYLFVDPEGKPLSQAAKDNLFTIHVLKALASTLDAHTSIYNPEEAYDMKVRLEKGMKGVGIVVRKSPDGVFIEKILKNSPAEKAKTVEVGDRLVEVNGRSAHTIPFEELLNMLRGDDAKQVTLLLKRRGGVSGLSSQQTFSVLLTPAMITVDDDRVDTSYVPYGNGIIGTVTLKSFYKGANGITSEKDVSDAIAKLQKIGNLKGLILDLRGNSGGFLTQAVKVAGLFITNGVIVISKYSNGEEHFYRDVDGKTSYNGPLVVLTSRTTASAAEIVAQALQDYGVAVVVGDPQTYGKGTIQSQTVTGDEHSASYFKVTVGKYYTVSGKTPQLEGVKADIVVPGELSFEEIGEEYLEDAIPADQISDSFSDQLADVDPQMKPWFLRYYVPSLQKLQHQWKSAVPLLKQNSAKRIQTNSAYQALLQRFSRNKDTPSKEDVSNIRKLQQEEAINIVKDMLAQDSLKKN